MFKRKTILLVLLSLLASIFIFGEGFQTLENSVIEKTLPNGMKVIILPRHNAPVFSGLIYADVGGANENQNATGLAHIFEHMAFKGTKTVGTKDYEKEKVALDKVEKAFLELRAAKEKKPKVSDDELKVLEDAFQKAQDEAQQFVVQNELGEILEREGVPDLNAFTNFDQTVYLYSLPSNKLELWAAIESDRFTNPVLREFYKEKDVIMEEKRMGQSSAPGKLLDDFMAVAYKNHMYRSFVIGNMSDLKHISRTEAEAWFDKYYRAKNLTAVLVGDVDPATAMPLVEKYLGKIPTGEKPSQYVSEEEVQRSEKRIVMEDPAQPFLVVAYHKPEFADPDNSVYDAIADILGGGRSSRLYTALVKEKKLALAAGAYTELGKKYPGLFLFFVVPNQGKTPEECEKALYEEIEKIKTSPVSKEELEGLKARSKTNFIHALDNNLGLALNLASYKNLTGDWRTLFNELDNIDKVTADDILRVANKTFVKNNRTVGIVQTVQQPSTEAK
jgi:predicted Zn-dependent peptidase